MTSSFSISFSNKLDKLSDKTLNRYEAGVMAWLVTPLDKLYPKDSAIFQELNQWQVYFWDSHESDPADFSSLVGQDKVLNFDIAHGLTNVANKTVNIYIKNMENDFQFLSNFYAAAHELDHMALAMFYPNKQAARRHPDKEVPAGTVGNFYVTEVHDRNWEIENGVRQNRFVKIYRPWYTRYFLGNITLAGIGVTDLFT